jgi:N-acetylmuramoyl-L-alanine amidase
MLNKRGQEEFIQELLMELLIGALMVLAFMWFANKVTNPANIDKEYLAKDLGLSTAFIQGMPYPILLSFIPLQTNLSKYSVNWTENLIVIASANDRYPQGQFYLRDTELFRSKFNVSKAPSIHFYNYRNRLVIKPQKQGTSLQEYACSSNAYSYSNIFIDSGHGEEEDTGAVFSYSSASTYYKESQYACDIARAVSAAIFGKTLLSSRPVISDTISCEAGRKKDITLDINQAEVIISFHAGDYPTEGNVIKAYVEKNTKYDEANAIACRILNALASETGADTALIPIDVNIYNLNQEFPMIGKKEVPTIIIELGSVASIKSRKMLQDTTIIGRLIAKVLNV